MTVSRNGPASEGTLADILTALGGGAASPTGPTNATAPTDATLVGGTDATGKLQGVASGRVVPTATLAEFLDEIAWAVFNTTPTTRTNGQGGPLEADASGNLRTAEQFTALAEDNTAGVIKVEQRYQYLNIATATTTTVKSGAGFFHMLIVNKAVAAATITIYDNTAGSGTKIATITFGAALLSDPPLSAEYDVSFATGLTIVTSGATDLTVGFR